MIYVCSDPHACDDFYQHQGAKIRYRCIVEQDYKAGYGMVCYCKIIHRSLPFNADMGFKEEIDKILEI
jgi:hypothetical protein